jgi:DNA-binding beta-propeller fold protein YncE
VDIRPRGIAVNPNTNMIYVANRISVINGGINKVDATIITGNYSTTSERDFPTGIVVNPTDNTCSKGISQHNIYYKW